MAGIPRLPGLNSVLIKASRDRWKGVFLEIAWPFRQWKKAVGDSVLWEGGVEGAGGGREPQTG